MSDWIVFLDTVSPLVLSGASFPRKVMQMWIPLRRALLYYVRYREGQHHEVHWTAARNDLLQYAALAEKNFGMHKLTTLQLHSAVVHLTDMVKSYGPAAFRMEFWVERMMQEFKQVTKFRTSCSPELVATNAWLLRRALAQRLGEDNNIDSLRRKVDPKSKTRDPPGRDKHDEDGNVMLGKLQGDNDATDIDDTGPVCFMYCHKQHRRLVRWAVLTVCGMCAEVHADQLLG